MILDLQGPASSEATAAQAEVGAGQCESDDKAVPAQDASDHDANEAGALLEPVKGNEVEPHSEAASSDSEEGSSSSSSCDGLDEDLQESSAFKNPGQQWMDPASCTDKARAKPSTCFPEAATSTSLCVAGPRHQTKRSCAPW